MINLKLALLGATLAFSAHAFADELEQCQKQLAVKDAQIMSLINAASGNTGTNVVVTTNTTYVCEAVCIHSMIGKGWTPGKLMRSSALVEGSSAVQAFQALINKCDKDNKDLFKSTNGKYASSNVAGIMTKDEINSPNWESYMVKAFQSEESYKKFCRKN